MASRNTKKEQAMSDPFDFTYRVEGSPAVQKKFLQTISHYRDEMAESSSLEGLKSPVLRHTDGSLTWSGWIGPIVFDIDESLVQITSKSAARIWAYHGEDSDDYIRGWVLCIEKGMRSESGFWDADVGYDAAMASIELQSTASVDAAMTLLGELDRACGRPGRLSAVLAQMLLEALGLHPRLASNAAVWTGIMELRSQIAASDIHSETVWGDSEQELDSSHIDSLFAKIEAGCLMEALSTPTGEACPPKAVRL